MQNRQSYIDALNAGRERRTASPYDQLDDTLSRLEERLDSLSRRTRRPGDHETGGQGNRRDSSREEIARRLERLTAPRSTGEAAEGEWRSSGSARPVTPNAPNASQESATETVARIADKLKQLREELKGDMSDTLSREFEVMRRDIEKAYVAAANGRGDDALSEELEQIAEAVKLLAERQANAGLAELKADVGTIKTGLAVLAREDTLRSQDDRWEAFSKRFQRIEQMLAALAGRDSDELNEIGTLLEQVASAVEGLPASLSLGSLEEKVMALSETMETFAGQSQSVSRKSFGQIEQRLDEISRAIAAASVAANSGSEPLNRIEARIATLSDQIDALGRGSDDSDIGERITLLSEQIEKFAASNTSSDQIVEILNDRLSAIAEKIEAVPSGDAMLGIVGEKIDKLASQIAVSETQSPNNELLERMQGRLDEIVSRLDEVPAISGATDTAMFHSLQSQLEDISRHLSQTEISSSGDVGLRLESIESTLADTRENLEAQLSELTSKISASPDTHGYPAELLAQLASLESSLEAARENLGGQLAEVAGYLATQPAGSTLHTDLPERLSRIEASLERTHETVLDVARLAAEEALKSLSGEGHDESLLSELTLDLKDLEQLTRKSEERNSRTFEAIHDTLLKIVDHLGELEPGASPASEPAPSYQPMTAPSLDDGIGEPLELSENMNVIAEDNAGDDDVDLDIIDRDQERGRLSPAEAAAAAAAAALENRRIAASEVKEKKPRKSMLGGLVRAFSSNKSATGSRDESTEADHVILDDEPVAPVADSMASDDDAPLEPGSGAPDLSAIMNRVREEKHSLPGSASASTAQSDFIAAARRAAQAAAAEADVLKRKSEKGAENSKRFAFGNLVGKNRKALMMGVAGVLVLAGAYQLSSAFLKGGTETPNNVAATEVQPLPSAETGMQAAAENTDADQSGTAQLAETEKMAAPLPEDDTAQPASKPDSVKHLVADSQNAGEASTDKTSTSATQTDAGGQITVPAPVMALPPFVSPSAVASGSDAEQKIASLSKGADQEGQHQAASMPSEQIAPLPESIGPVALRSAVEQGDPKAMFEVATRYAEGRGVPADPAEAANWYRQAATLGLAAAQYRYGSILEKGTGVKRDLNAAVDWYQKAAQQGNASAMHNLAVLFAMGAVGPADNEAAVRWFRKAADLGVTDSQFNLGIMAAKGAGMPSDLEESYKWFALAAKSGDKDAAQKRDEVAKALTPDQLSKARATVELWKAKTADVEANSVEIPDAWTGTASETASVDMKKAIRNIQILLANHGYDPGTPDGIMGEKTKSAIAAYQKASGLPATGEIDETLVRKLLDKNG